MKPPAKGSYTGTVNGHSAVIAVDCAVYACWVVFRRGAWYPETETWDIVHGGIDFYGKDVDLKINTRSRKTE